jgi:hypothetical protein
MNIKNLNEDLVGLRYYDAFGDELQIKKIYSIIGNDDEIINDNIKVDLINLTNDCEETGTLEEVITTMIDEEYNNGNYRYMNHVYEGLYDIDNVAVASPFHYTRVGDCWKKNLVNWR